MRPPIIISGGGIIGSYISSRLSRHNIKNYVVEKRPQLLEKSNKIRTLILNKNSIELLEKEGVIIKNQNVTNINAKTRRLFDGKMYSTKLTSKITSE